jgi:hypothetical protein
MPGDDGDGEQRRVVPESLWSVAWATVGDVGWAVRASTPWAEPLHFFAWSEREGWPLTITHSCLERGRGHEEFPNTLPHQSGKCCRVT